MHSGPEVKRSRRWTCPYWYSRERRMGCRLVSSLCHGHTYMILRSFFGSTRAAYECALSPSDSAWSHPHSQSLGFSSTQKSSVALRTVGTAADGTLGSISSLRKGVRSLSLTPDGLDIKLLSAGSSTQSSSASFSRVLCVLGSRDVYDGDGASWSPTVGRSTGVSIDDEVSPPHAPWAGAPAPSPPKYISVTVRSSCFVGPASHSLHQRS
mmetsp:Transcript_16816/g.40346  ORF Transcript_16816/g.40346 Transcript_16816/m.40346 type:complete len:210 (-) Transcript_16816:113-742(-)